MSANDRRPIKAGSCGRSRLPERGKAYQLTANAAEPRQGSRASAYGQKNTPPARASRRRLRLGFSERRTRIISASGFSVAAASNRRLRRVERPRSVFRTDAAAWPHRAGTLTRPRRWSAHVTDRTSARACGRLGAGRRTVQLEKGRTPTSWALRWKLFA